MKNRIDTKDHILVNLPSGKLTKKDERKALKGQMGLSCTVFATRRIGVFDKNKIGPYYQAFKKIRHALNNCNGDYAPLVTLATDLCSQFKIDAESTILSDPVLGIFRSSNQYKPLSNEQFIKQIPHHLRWTALYLELIKKVISPLLNIKESTWEPDQGPEALLDSLRKNGAHVFVGKFGAFYHTKQPISYSKENLDKREVYAFPKNSFDGKKTNWVHAIVVDQLKLVDGQYRIFFRDPYDSSSPSNNEKIYTLSYEAFLERLTDPYTISPIESPFETFGWTSTMPEKLVNSFTSKP